MKNSNRETTSLTLCLSVKQGVVLQELSYFVAVILTFEYRLYIGSVNVATVTSTAGRGWSKILHTQEFIFLQTQQVALMPQSLILV